MTRDLHSVWLDACRATDAAARRVAAEACEGLGVSGTLAASYRAALAAEQAARRAWQEAAVQVAGTPPVGRLR